MSTSHSEKAGEPTGRPGADAEAWCDTEGGDNDRAVFREPASAPGARNTSYSPQEFFALTRTQRVDIDADDDLLWFTEADVHTVHKDGIELHAMTFWDEGLRPYVSGASGSPRPTLKVRYDRALAARGVLDEVRVILVELDGRRREVCRARPRIEALSQIDQSEVVRNGHEYLRQLRAKRKMSEQEWLKLQSSTEAMLQLVREQGLRKRRQRGAKPAPRVATPLEMGQDERPPRDEYREQLREREQERRAADFRAADETTAADDRDVQLRHADQRDNGPSGDPAEGAVDVPDETVPRESDTSDDAPTPAAADINGAARDATNGTTGRPRMATGRRTASPRKAGGTSGRAPKAARATAKAAAKATAKDAPAPGAATPAPTASALRAALGARTGLRKPPATVRRGSEAP